jgi:hypothetical protein
MRVFVSGDRGYIGAVRVPIRAGSGHEIGGDVGASMRMRLRSPAAGQNGAPRTCVTWRRTWLAFQPQAREHSSTG